MLSKSAIFEERFAGDGVFPASAYFTSTVPETGEAMALGHLLGNLLGLIMEGEGVVAQRGTVVVEV